MVGAEGRHGLAAGRLPVQKLINCFACMPHESLLWLKQRSGDRIGLAIWGWLEAYETTGGQTAGMLLTFWGVKRPEWGSDGSEYGFGSWLQLAPQSQTALDIHL